MSPEVQAATVAFIGACVADGRRNVSLEWYGGEPLLAKDTVLSMTTAIHETVIRAGGCLKHVGIVTNGSLLAPATAAELQAAGVSEAQVSFDALLYVEGEKRGVLDAEGGPSPILLNVLSATSFLRMTLRVNVSSENKGDISNITEVLSTHGLAGSYYLARVDNFAGANSVSRPRGEGQFASQGMRQLPIVQVTSGTAGLARVQGGGPACNDSAPSRHASKIVGRGAFARMEQKSFASPEMLQQLADKLRPKEHFCSATTGAMFVIDADGDISRCWESAGVKSESIGNVLTERRTVEEKAVNAKWEAYHPLAYSACADCRVLPLCMGGCSYPRVVHDATNPECTSIRQQIDFCVDEVAKRLKLP